MFGAMSLLGDGEEDSFMGAHMRQMHQMNNMMRSFLDPFSMFGGGNPLAIGGPRMHAGAMMPFMPQMPQMNALLSADLDPSHMGMGHSYSSRTVVMSSGPNGNPQVYSTSSSTKIGPNGIKETRKTLEDSRTGTKKMSIGHHIGERGHVIERAQNLYSGEREESQEFYNIEEEEAEDFDREFQEKSGSYNNNGSSRAAIQGTSAGPRLAIAAPPLAIGAPPPANPAPLPDHNINAVRSVYSGSHPQRHRHRRPRHDH